MENNSVDFHHFESLPHYNTGRKGITSKSVKSFRVGIWQNDTMEKSIVEVLVLHCWKTYYSAGLVLQSTINK